MKRKWIPTLGVMALLVLVTTQVFAEEITIRGKLQRTVEAGGWVIVTADQKYLVLNARRFQNEKWFREAAEVEATGEAKSDVMTTFMEGTPFEVRMMRPFGGRSRRKSKRIKRSYPIVGYGTNTEDNDPRNYTKWH